MVWVASPLPPLFHIPLSPFHSKRWVLLVVQDTLATDIIQDTLASDIPQEKRSQRRLLVPPYILIGLFLLPSSLISFKVAMGDRGCLCPGVSHSEATL